MSWHFPEKFNGICFSDIRQHQNIKKYEHVDLKLHFHSWNVCHNYLPITVNWMCQLENITFNTGINQGQEIIGLLNPDITTH